MPIGITADSNELLIMAISSRPALYDHRLPISDRSRNRIHRLWEEVVMEVDGHFNDLQEIQLRWRSLRDRFVEESQSSMAKSSGDEGGRSILYVFGSAARKKYICRQSRT